MPFRFLRSRLGLAALAGLAVPSMFAACALEPLNPVEGTTSGGTGGAPTTTTSTSTDSTGTCTDTLSGCTDTTSTGTDTTSTGTDTGTGGTMSGQGGTMSGQGGSTSGQGGSTSGQGGSTSGQGDSTSGQGGSTSGQGGSTSGQGGSTSQTTTGAGGSTSTTSSATTGAGGSASTTSTTTTGAGGDPDAGAGDASADASACSPVESLFTPAPGVHVASCSPITYATNPPSSGPHYPIWAAFKSYSVPVPWGFLVHALEHGAVVVAYNCPSGCASDVAALQAYLDARPADPLCVAPLKNRFIVVPDPLLDVPFAASAWGATLKAQCFDLPALGAFIDAHYAKAPENFCFDGTDVSDPAAGIPANCGQ